MQRQPFPITNLTKDGILLLEENIKDDIFVQIIKFEELKRGTDGSASKNKYFKVTLSDGFAWNLYVFIAEAAVKLENTPIFSVIKPSNDIKTLPKNKHKMFVDYEIINQLVGEIIGSPLEIEVYKKKNHINLEGNTSIPWKYLNLDQKPFPPVVPIVKNEEILKQEKIEPDDGTKEYQNFQTPLKKHDIFKQNNMTPNHSRIKEEVNNDESKIISNIETSKKNFLEKFKFVQPVPQNKLRFEPREKKDFFYPISGLKPNTPVWKIKARVIKKNELKTFMNFKNEQSCLLKITLIDKNRDEINAVFFGDDAQFYNENLQEGKVYGFGGGTLKKSNPNYSSTKHDYEITFDRNSDIIPLVDEEENMIPKFEFKAIKEIVNMSIGAIVDVKGIVYDTNAITDILMKSGDKIKKKQILLYDDSEEFIEISLWGKISELDLKKNDIVSFKRLKISEFANKKNLNTTFDTVIFANNNIDIPEMKEFKTWAKSEKKSDFENKNRKSFGADSKMKFDEKIYTLDQMIVESDELLGTNNKRVFTSFFHMLRFENEGANNYYESCIMEKCNKKVSKEENGQYRCESCQKSFEEPKVRYRLKAFIADHTANLTVTIFDEVGNDILGISANELKILKDAGMLDEISNTFGKAKFYEMKGKILAKYDNYKGDKIDYSLFGFSGLKNNSKECMDKKFCEIENYFREIEESKNII